MQRLVVLMAALAMCAGASASYSSTFEPALYLGTPAGTLMTGQDGWTNPVAGSYDFRVFTYAGNTYGVAANPTGATQFAGGLMNGAAAFARAQHTYAWTSGDIWSVSYDVLGMYVGTLPAVNNLGSFSLQPSTGRYFQSILLWVDPATAAAWNLGYLTLEYPAAPGVIPGPEWQNLVPNHWYRSTAVFQMSTQTILAVAIKDLTTSVTTYYNNPGWHFINPTLPAPTAFRFFTGGGSGTSPMGNFTAWDNLTIVPWTTGACCLPDSTCVPDLLPADCETQGGTFLGVGTGCEPNPCHFGACCFADGSCQSLRPGDCRNQGGVFQGDDTVCTPNPCPQPGACCFPDGSCQVMLEASCLAIFGAWDGPNTVCTPNPCPPPCVTPPPGAVPEGEPNCGLPDTFNGGCNNTPNVFSTITCGETVFGTTGTNGASRDLDWYQLVAANPTDFVWTATGTFPIQLLVIQAGPEPTPCTGYVIVGIATADACMPATVTMLCQPAGKYWFVVSPQLFTGTWCGAPYVATLTCPRCGSGACCFSNGDCQMLLEPECITAQGIFSGVDIACDPNPCTPAIVRGDCNCDGLVNAFDIDPFILALTNPAAYALAFPNCNILTADVNCDTSVNAFDIDPFIVCLTSPSGCAPCPP